jgi:hypothetical protein
MLRSDAEGYAAEPTDWSAERIALVQQVTRAALSEFAAGYASWLATKGIRRRAIRKRL